MLIFYNLIWKFSAFDQFSEQMKELPGLYQAKIVVIFSKLVSFYFSYCS